MTDNNVVVKAPLDYMDVNKVQKLSTEHHYNTCLSTIVAYSLTASIRYRWIAHSLRGANVVLYKAFFEDLADKAHERSNEAIKLLAMYGGELDIVIQHEPGVSDEVGELIVGSMNIERTVLSAYLELVGHANKNHAPLFSYATSASESQAALYLEIQQILVGLK